MSSSPPDPREEEDFVTGPPKITEVDFRDFCAEMAAEEKHARREKAAAALPHRAVVAAGRAPYASDNNNKTDDKDEGARASSASAESNTACVCVFHDGAWTPPLAVMGDGRVNMEPDRPEAQLILLTDILDRQAQTGVELVRFIDT